MLVIRFTLLTFLILVSSANVAISQSKKKIEKEAALRKEFEEWRARYNSIKMPYREEDGGALYEIIDSVNAIGSSKQDMVTAFKSALADVLNQAKQAIDVDDREGGLVVAKIADELYYDQKITFLIRYTIRFQSKDDRFRLQLTNVEMSKNSKYYYSYYNTLPEYERLDDSTSPELTEEEKFEQFKKATPEQRNQSIAFRLRMHERFNSIVNGLSTMTIKNLKDKF